ncbi:hypothetical protein [Bizionia sp.]|uniref:hypothetical protein n=1 Tax=Bizionia sp. TaxID=1954480 RepID=UPI003A8D051F
MLTLIATACSKDDAPSEPPVGTNLPITLDCDYFNENPDVHLTDDPNAPVDYIITCDPKMSGDFIIDAGVVIAFESDAGLILGKYGNGIIQMNGTAEKPIILTGTQKDKGSWRGVQISSDNPANQMTYVTIEYAGQTGRGGWALQGSLIGTYGAVLEMNHCTVQHGHLIGFHWYNNSKSLTLSNSTFTGNDTPIKTSVNHINTIDGSSTYSGNVNDYIKLSANDVIRDVTFHKTDVPFLSVGFKPDNSAKRRFTFKPGATILMEAGSLIRFQNAFHYNHEIIMVGTAEDPITIKGKEDVAGYWDGIQIDYTTNPLNEIGFLDIANAGKTNGYPNGAILLRSGDLFLNMHDVNFIKCFEYGVSIESPSAINFSYNNLNLVNTPKLFSDWQGGEIIP